MILNSKWKMVALNILGGLAIFFILVAMRAFILFSPVQSLSSDEAFQAYQILSLMNGEDLFFYFDGNRYAGIFYGLVAVPFFWILGVSSLAYKLPGVLFYTLYILSSYWIAKTIKPTSALVVVFLMIFSSPAVLLITANNWPHNLICLLGNLIFLTFFRLMDPKGFRTRDILLLGFLMGFSIYTYTYSILYIFSIGIVFALSSNYFRTVRDKISAQKILNWAKGTKGERQWLKKILDFLICVFGMVTVFSYIFGGFGIDIAGHSILQTNKLGTPVYQLSILLLFRVCLFYKDIKSTFQLVKYFILSINPLTKHSMMFGFLGFVIGISPRLASIITGETSRGGQGFDVDFIPSKLGAHFWQLITHQLPEIIGIRAPVIELLYNQITPFSLLYCLLAAMALFLISKSTIFFISPLWQDFKDISRLRVLSFSPSQVFIVFPVMVFFANIIIQHGPVTRYLLPLSGIIAIWIGLYLDDVRKKSRSIFVFWLVVLCMFSSIDVYKKNAASDVVNDYSIVGGKNSHSKVIKFLEVNKIFYAYSGYSTASSITFFSERNIKVAEYNKAVFGKRIKKQLAGEGEFAVIVPHYNQSHLNDYRKYMDENLFSYSQNIVEGDDNLQNRHYIFWNFEGEPEAIEALRSLVP